MRPNLQELENLASFIDGAKETPLGAFVISAEDCRKESAAAGDVWLERVHALASSIGMPSGFIMPQPNGEIHLSRVEYYYLKFHLESALRVLRHVPEKSTVMPFTHGIPADMGILQGHPRLKELLSGTHMLATVQDSDGTVALETYVQDIPTVVESMAILRPDIATQIKNKWEASEPTDDDMYGRLPMTSKQVRDFTSSFRQVIRELQEKGEGAAFDKIKAIRDARPHQFEPKPANTRVMYDMDIKGNPRMKLSERPREDSTEHFMVDLDVIQPALDVCKHFIEESKHADGIRAKYFSTKAVYWIRESSKEQAEYDHAILSQFVKGQDPKKISEAIWIEKDFTESRKHPSYWLSIPSDVFTNMQAEYSFIHDARDDVRKTFDRGEREEAMQLKEDLLNYITPRIAQGHHMDILAQRLAAEGVETQR